MKRMVLVMRFVEKLILVATLGAASATAFAEQNAGADRDKFMDRLLGEFEAANVAERQHYYDDFTKDEASGAFSYSFALRKGKIRFSCQIERVEVSAPDAARIVARGCVQQIVNAQGEATQAKPATPEAVTLEVRIAKTYEYEPGKPTASEIMLNGKRLWRYEGGGGDEN